MIKATTAAAETERELKRAIDTACSLIEAEYETASRNFKQGAQEYTKRTQDFAGARSRRPDLPRPRSAS